MSSSSVSANGVSLTVNWEFVQLDHGTVLNVTVSGAVGLEPEVLRFLTCDVHPITKAITAQFDGVCSPSQLADYPIAAGYQDADPKWFRQATCSLRFDDKLTADEAQRDLLGALESLVRSVARLTVVAQTTTKSFGDVASSSSSEG